MNLDTTSSWGTAAALAYNGIRTTNGNGALGGYATWRATQADATWVTVNNGTLGAMTSFNSALAAGGDVNLGYDQTVGQAGTLNGAATVDTLRLNSTSGSYSFNGNLTLNKGGIMLTSADTTLTGDSVVIGGGLLSTGAGQDLVVVQNNTTVSMTINSGLSMGTMGLVKIGSGLLTLNGTASYTGRTAIYGGTLAITSASDLGTLPGSFVADQLVLGGGLKMSLPNGSLGLGANYGVTLAGNGFIDSGTTDLIIGAVTSGATTWGFTKYRAGGT